MKQKPKKLTSQTPNHTLHLPRVPLSSKHWPANEGNAFKPEAKYTQPSDCDEESVERHPYQLGYGPKGKKRSKQSFHVRDSDSKVKSLAAQSLLGQQSKEHRIGQNGEGRSYPNGALKVLKEAEQEFKRRGNFSLIFPTSAPSGHCPYRSLLSEAPSGYDQMNTLLHQWLSDRGVLTEQRLEDEV